MIEHRIRTALFAIALAGAVGAAPAPASAQTATPQASKQKVIFHVGDGDPAKWTVAFNNVFNVRKDLGAANVDIEVVAVNAGVGMLKLDSPEGNRIAEAMKGGVRVVACENSMRGQKLTREDLLPDIGYVQAGVVELMQRQKEGYAYIRP